MAQLQDSKKYQTIILRLSDGRRISALVPAFLDRGEVDVDVVSIQVTEACELPDSMYFGRLDD